MDSCAILSFNETSDPNTAIKVYPNPTNGILNIDTNNILLEKVECYDVLGRLELTKDFNSDAIQVDLTDLNAGNYLIKLFTAEGIQNMKVIKN